MKHKLLISLIAALGLATTTTVVNASPVQAKIIRSTKSKHSIKYFNKWRTIALSKNTRFTEILDNLAPQSMWNRYQKFQLQGRSKVLPKGTVIKIKNGKYDWIIKSNKLPVPKRYYHWTTEAISNYIKYEKPIVAPSIFNKQRKVKLIKNVEMIKQCTGHPFAFTRIIGFKTLKKGSVVTVESGSRYPYIVYGKQLPTSNKDDFWITSKKGVWYKILN